jgi:hypothetical protein
MNKNECLVIGETIYYWVVFLGKSPDLLPRSISFPGVFLHNGNCNNVCFSVLQKNRKENKKEETR